VKREGSGPNGSLRAEFRQAGDGIGLVTLSGSIDENSDLAAVFAGMTTDSVMNLQQVERVNSMGVHRWIPLVTQFTQQHRLVIEEISYALVQNANVVANLFGAAQLQSCMAPYYCARCKDNCTVKVTAAEVASAGQLPPPKICPSCEQVMEFDELDGYFAFFKTRPRR
jgi:hypothetical protein